MTVKTAITLDRELFQKAEAVATDMKVSRSQVVGLALSEYPRRHANRLRLEAVNRAYADPAATSSGTEPVRRYAFSHRQLVEGTW